MTASAVCDQCGQACIVGSVSTGYGQDDGGIRLCYRCCAIENRERMIEDGRATLYLVKSDKGCGLVPGWQVTNWPGSLQFRCGTPKAGRHNIAGSRQDVWFRGPNGATWWGVQYGQWSDVCHCRRIAG